MEFDRMISCQVLGLVQAYNRSAGSEGAEAVFLDRTLRLLCRARSHRLTALLTARHNRRVLTGPFAGMDYTSEQSEGAIAPKLMGTYEAELHPTLLRLAAAGITRVADVGCAEGYYAVGLARLMPKARVEAFDIDPRARALCKDLAARNGVADRVAIRERWSVEAMGAVAAGTLVFMDAEGAELELLGPEAPQALRSAELVVETHPALASGVVETLCGRFAATHEIEKVFEAPKQTPTGAFGQRLQTLDDFAATWEWRATPTPWLVMRPRG